MPDFKEIMEHVKTVRTATKFGTEFGDWTVYTPGVGIDYHRGTSAAELDKQLKGGLRKVVGLGASAGFLTGGSFAVRLASMSILHRYRRYRQMKRDFYMQTSRLQEEERDVGAESCLGSNPQLQCPAGSVCTTGLCLCQEGGSLLANVSQ